ncbi:MAG TPA: hypothetical protein VER14_07225, partial [Phototrophicaceae bacterium]|nr:hypothetical protein [Phototrophicaceae bacterium]
DCLGEPSTFTITKSRTDNGMPVFFLGCCSTIYSSYTNPLFFSFNLYCFMRRWVTNGHLYPRQWIEALLSIYYCNKDISSNGIWQVHQSNDCGSSCFNAQAKFHVESNVLLLAGHRQITLRIIPDMMIFLQRPDIHLISAVGIVKMVVH